MSEVGLLINESLYEGWTEVELRFGVEQLAPTFSLGFSERWHVEDEPVPIREGDKAEILVDRKKVLTGWVGTFSNSYSNDDHTLQIEGASRTVDLADCSAIHKGAFKGKTIQGIAEALCTPFGITVSTDPSTLDIGSPINRFRVQPGESVFEALTRLTRRRGLLMTSDADGNLVFTRAATEELGTVSVERGVNVKRGSFRGDERDRFSEYLFRGQSEADDDWNGVQAGQLEGRVEDPHVPRHRPLSVLATHKGKEDLGQRAIWERNTRAGRSETLSYTVREWSNERGLWRPNTIVKVKDDLLRFNDNMLISTVTLAMSKDRGTVADLELVGPAAYDVGDAPSLR